MLPSLLFLSLLIRITHQERSYYRSNITLSDGYFIFNNSIIIGILPKTAYWIVFTNTDITIKNTSDILMCEDDSSSQFLCNIINSTQITVQTTHRKGAWVELSEI